MRHLKHILAVAVPVAIAAASTLIASPAVAHFVAAHPADAGYVALAAGVIRAVVKAYRQSREAQVPPTPPVSSSTMKAL